MLATRPGALLMHFAIIFLVIQVLLIIHVVRTGREMWWILVLLFLPGIGSLIYLIIEVLPSLGGNVTARRTARTFGRMIDPTRELREARLEYERNRSVGTTTRLAEALVRNGKPDEAIEICKQARTGVFEDDPTILLTLGSAYFAKGAYAETIEALDRLRQTSPKFHSPDGHLLYARALEAAGESQRALEEYEAVSRYYPGAEARVRYAQLHKRMGHDGVAREMLQRILDDARLAPRHFRVAQREWIDLAKHELGG
jgi:hypothetical protein